MWAGCSLWLVTSNVELDLCMQGASDALPWENQNAPGGAGPSAAAPGANALQPWGNTAGTTASSAQERSGNAEITPLEVSSQINLFLDQKSIDILLKQCGPSHHV